MNIIILFLSGLSFVWCTSYMALRNIILSAQKRNGAPPIMYEDGSIKTNSGQRWSRLNQNAGKKPPPSPFPGSPGLYSPPPPPPPPPGLKTESHS